MLDQTSTLLDEYNRQIMQIQDGVYTFACDLLGDEAAATTLTREAFLHCFCRGRNGGKPIRQAVLRYITDNYRGFASAASQKTVLRFARLSAFSRLVLFLVDHLGLSYAEAASVLRCSPSKVCRRLAFARWKIGKCDRIKSRSFHAENAHPGGRR